MIPNHGITGTDVAIIGMAGRFPGARSVEEFWANLRDGIVSIDVLSEEELISAGVSPEEFGQADYVRVGARVRDVDKFDAGFFGYTPREAEIMDPQQRIFLETAWEALEQAGYDPSRYDGRIGVFGGTGSNGYLHHVYSNPEVVDAVGQTQILLGNEIGFLASRVSYKMDLRGPSISLRTACSTSLAAVHLGCQSLLDGDSDMVLAGGSFVNLAQDRGYLYQDGGFMSPDGRCRPFDADAGGTVFGSGVGLVVLKRFTDAMNDGDTIYAVVKGSAVNNDGAVKVGFTAPGVRGQAEVITRALERAGVAAQSIGYVETHGTGTVLGDPIELRALTMAYRRHTDLVGYCAIGSLKANVGHLDAAAGIASLIKVVLALHHEAIPPTANFNRANPAVELDGSPFRVQRELSRWPRADVPRKAAVSAFGFGGANAHVVLEEGPVSAAEASRRPSQLLVLSARSWEALETLTDNLADRLRRYAQPLEDVAFTLAQGRHCFAFRRIVVADDVQSAAALLESREPARVASRSTTRERPDVAFLFSGQGAQFPGMAVDIYRNEPVFRSAVDACVETLRSHVGLDLRPTMFAAPDDVAAADRLRRTEFAQPALFTVEYALAELWRSWGVVPSALLGHSLGEYVAACLAGVFSLADALALVALRGRLMQAQPGGAMLSVLADRTELASCLPDDLSLAAHNGDTACVIAGSHAAVAAFADTATACGWVTQPVATSHGFHSALMRPMVPEFIAAVAGVQRSAPTVPFVSNVSGTWISSEEAQDPMYWGRHVCAPVEFVAGVRTLGEDGDRLLVEVGPGQTLSGLARRILKDGSTRLITSSLPHRNDRRGALQRMQRTLGEMWLAGIQPDWTGYYRHERRRRVSLPPYPFERDRFWLRPGDGATARASQTTSSRQVDIADWFYVPSWQESSVSRSVPSTVDGSWIVFLDRLGLGEALAARLCDSGASVTTVAAAEAWRQLDATSFAVDPSSGADYQRLLTALSEGGRASPEHIVHCFNVTEVPSGEAPPAAQPDAAELAFESLFHLARAIGEHQDGVTRRMWVLSNGLFSVTDQERLQPEKATLLGPSRVIPREYPGLSCTNVDVVLDDLADGRLVDNLLTEVTGEPSAIPVAYRGRRRWRQEFARRSLAPAADGATALREGGVYLITGGLGGLGLAIAERLARMRCRIILTSRTALPPAAEWHGWLGRDPVTDRVASAVRTLCRLESMGAELLVVQADVCDAEAMGRAVGEGTRRWGVINGVFHAAGVAGGGLMQVRDTAAARAVLRPKVEGTMVLERVLATHHLDFLLLFGSNAANLGDFGQVDYVAANAFLDAFAHVRAGRQPVMAIDWGPWREVGMAVSTEVPRGLEEVRRRDLAVRGMSPTEGLEALDRLLAAPLTPQVVVSPVDLSAVFASAFRLTADGDALSGLKPAGLARPRPSMGSSYVPPATEVQRRMCAVWQESLGFEQVGIEDSFFDLGGNSLIAIQVIAAINRELGSRLTVARLYEGLTVNHLAHLVGGDDEHGGVGLRATMDDRRERMQRRRQHQQQRMALRGR
ncbi:SDR family NAD(P)-dependent oxidoreductase [Plantactinospora sp. ZYX-F-223]|uniref:type I polyketide synthase n=1 Tax=Plantactinospora sp. ZYX-F-223 TaxID=3144103 RepID=UPI0031FD643F